MMPLQTAFRPEEKKQKTRDSKACNVLKLYWHKTETASTELLFPSTATAQEQKAAPSCRIIFSRSQALPFRLSQQAGLAASTKLSSARMKGLTGLGIPVNFNELGADGFVLKTDSLRLIIAGGNDKGTLFGVYTFLEKYLGCRMYAPKVKFIPVKDTIIVGKIEDKEIPEIKYRTIHYKDSWDAEYVDWHKLNHDAEGERPAWGTWVHTFNHLVPPEIYFNDHPEYLCNARRKKATYPALSFESRGRECCYSEPAPGDCGGSGCQILVSKSERQQEVLHVR